MLAKALSIDCLWPLPPHHHPVLITKVKEVSLGHNFTKKEKKLPRGAGQRRQRTGACLEFSWMLQSIQSTMGFSSWQGLLSWLSPPSHHKSSSLSQEKHHHGQVVVFIMKVSVIYLSFQDSPNKRNLVGHV